MESPRYRRDENSPDGSGRHGEPSPPDLEFVWPPTAADLDRLAVVWLDEAARAQHESALARPVSRAPSSAEAVVSVTPAAFVAPDAAAPPHAAATPRVTATRQPAAPPLNWPPSADDLRAITVLERGSQPASIVPDAVVSPSVPGFPAQGSPGTPAARQSWSRLQRAAVALGAIVVMAATARPMLDRLRAPAPQPTTTLAVNDNVAGVADVAGLDHAGGSALPSAGLEAPASATNTTLPSPPPDLPDSARAPRSDDVVGGTPLARDGETTREPTRAPAPRPAAEPDRQSMATRDAPVAGGTIAALPAPSGAREPVESAPPPPPRDEPAVRAAAPETVAAPLPETPPTLPARVTIGGAPSRAGTGSSDASAGTSTRIPAPPDDEARIRATLGRYRSAYQQLDASAAKAVWPSVDQRALARAFEGLRLQEVVFDACRLSLAGETAAATCQGRATYVARVGNSAPRVQPRQWIFALRRAGANWLIQDVRVQ